MIFVSTILVLFVAIVLLLQLLWLFLEVAASLTFKAQSDDAPPRRTARVCVIVPAHNEQSCIAATLNQIKPQLLPDDQLLVIADNCTDRTAAISKGVGADVIERNDKSLLGKGYALDYAINYLRDSRVPDVVLFVDADCNLTPGSVDRLAEICVTAGSPAQATNLMVAEKTARSNLRIAEFAWKLKNYIRPLGAYQLGFPCQVTGTGMAFPWALISVAELATGHIVEDTKLGIELMISGHKPVFCPAARVISRFASGEEGTKIQRTRWEHGHLTMIREYLPLLLQAAFSQKSLSLLAMAIDLSIPPLGLIAIACFFLAIAGLAITHLGAPAIASLFAASPLLLFVGTILLAWFKFGREILTARDFLSIPVYAVSKLPMLWGFIFRRQTKWVRSVRDQE
jgi:cellulose synthase/poly-beta-1,6-N-acetylglucosamine synthase-like glycosyltransferase